MVDVTQTMACIQCGACVSDCLAMEVDPGFIGPAALAKAYRFVGDPRDDEQLERLNDLAQDPQGIFDCTHCFKCVEACPKDVNPMGQIMRLRRIATSDHHIVDHNNGERHEAAFTTLIKDNGLLLGGRAAAALLRRQLVVRQVPPGRRQRAAVSSLPSIVKALLRGKVTPKVALKPHKIPKQRPEGVQAIYDKVEGREQRYELNLYIAGEDEEPPRPKSPRPPGSWPQSPSRSPRRRATARRGAQTTARRSRPRREREPMKVAYWPGCVSRGFTPELHGSMAKVAPLLDIELVELDRACCTGAGVIAEHNQELADTLNARTFALAQQVEGAELMMNICSTCQGAQSECQERLDANAEYREHVNETLAGEGLSYEKGLTTRTSCGCWSRRSASTSCARGSSGRSPTCGSGPFYGCYIVRPRERLGIDDEHPRDHYLHQVIEALGGTVIDYAGMRKCCGFPIITMNKEASLKQAGRHLGDAVDAEADCLVTPCPLCHLNLDLQQPLAETVGRPRARHAGAAPAPARRPGARARAEGARHEPPRRAPDLGDRLVDVGRRRRRLSARGAAALGRRRSPARRRPPSAGDRRSAGA